MTDYKQPCAELVEQLDDALYFTVSSETRRHMKLLTRKARAALAEPEPEGPSFSDVMEWSHGIEPWATWLAPGGCLESAHFEFDQLVTSAIARWGRPTRYPGDLAARPLLERVARMGDCIDANTVGEIIAISDRAAAWLRENPPGRPVAIEPRGCPTPGACSCVEPQPPVDGEVAELVAWLLEEAVQAANSDAPHSAGMLTWAAQVAGEHAELLSQRYPQPVPLSERLPGWEDCDAEGRCWIHMPDIGTAPSWRLVDPREIGPYHTHWLPASALPLPQLH